MQTFKSFLDQAFLIWKDSTGAARIGIALLLVLFMGAILGIGVWSSQPQYVVLANGLTPVQARDATAALETASIKYKRSESGSTVMVDKQKLAEARSATADLGIESSTPNFFTTDLGMDPDQKKAIETLNREIRVKATIEGFRFVKSAEVHLTIPRKEAFMRSSDPPSASVVLELVRQAQFGDAEASTIAGIIAGAVPLLSADRVFISDTFGNQYSTNPRSNSARKNTTFRMTREMEFESAVRSVLNRYVGVGNSEVSVSLEYQYPDRTTTSNTFEKGVIQKELFKKTEKPVDSSSGGSGGSSNPVETDETDDKTYDNSSVVKTEVERTPVLTKTSVAVVVNQTAIEDENGVIPTDLIASIKKSVQLAAGLKLNQDEFVSVEFAPFADFLPLEEPAGFVVPWDKINQILKNVSLGIAALVAMLLGFKALKKIQPDPINSTEATERSSQVNQLSDLVQQNPEVFSKIIESWSSLDSRNDEDNQSKAA